MTERSTFHRAAPRGRLKLKFIDCREIGPLLDGSANHSLSADVDSLRRPNSALIIRRESTQRENCSL